HANDLERLRLEMHAVPNQQMNSRLLTCCYHLPAFGGVECHRLFADHVLPCGGDAETMRFMERIRRSHVDHIDVRIILDLIEVLVVVAVLIRDTVFLFPVCDLGGCAADHAHQRCFLAIFHCVCYSGPIASQPHDGDPKYFVVLVICHSGKCVCIR